MRQAGIDEAGRGCLAGPVVAAAVVLPPGYALEGLTDSKKLSAAQRARLRARLEAELPPGSWAIGTASPEEIDERNILCATYLAMHRAVAQLHPVPTDLLVDGNRFAPYPNIQHRCEVKGDARFACISAASIFAKTERDALMERAHEQFPDYGWNVNKGYPTDAHRKALEAHGESPYHRKTFRWKPVQMKLFSALLLALILVGCASNNPTTPYERAVPAQSLLALPWSQEMHQERHQSAAWRRWERTDASDSLAATWLDSAQTDAQGRLVWHRTGAQGTGWLWLGDRRDFDAWRTKSSSRPGAQPTSKAYAGGTVWNLGTDKLPLYLGEKNDLVALSAHETLIDEAFRQLDVEEPQYAPHFANAGWDYDQGFSLLPDNTIGTGKPNGPMELTRLDSLRTPWVGWSATATHNWDRLDQGQTLPAPGRLPWTLWLAPEWSRVQLEAVDGSPDSVRMIGCTWCRPLPGRESGYWWGEVQGIHQGLPVRGWLLSAPDSTTAWDQREHGNRWVHAAPSALVRATPTATVWASSEEELRILVQALRAPQIPFDDAPQKCHSFGLRRLNDSALPLWVQWVEHTPDELQFTVWAGTLKGNEGE